MQTGDSRGAMRLARRGTWLIALVLASVAPSGAAQDCLQQLANKVAAGVGAGPGYVIKPQSGTIQRWMYKNGDWVIGTVMGVAVGANPQNPSPNINLWPQAFNQPAGSNLCAADFLGKLFPVLVHEMLHFLCPPHSDSGVPASQLSDLTKKPTSTPTPPNCNDINYAVNSAKKTCEEIGKVAACCADPDCGGLKDASGNQIPGLERDKLKDYCKSLSESYSEMQERWNTEEIANIAFGCNCPTPWSPGAGYANCPTMGSPPGGCSGTAADAYPGNKVIPDCDKSCPEDC